MIQLNLLPDVKKEFIKAQKARNRVISLSILTMVVAVGLTVLAALYVYGGQTIAINVINGQIKEKSAKLQDENGVGKDLGKYLTVQNQLGALPELHQNKTMYSRLYDFLPQLNPKAPNSVSFTTLLLDEEQKNIVFTGNASTFEAMNVFKDTLLNATVEYKTEGSDDVVQDKLFSDLQVQSANLGRANNRVLVNFQISVVYDEDTFKPTSKDIKLNIPNIQTTQSAVQSPQAVFGEGR